MTPPLTHMDKQGRVNMVDISQKPVSERTAIARGYLQASKDTLTLVSQGKATKGDVLAVAELAGVMATKRTADLIPLCHTLAISAAKVNVEIISKTQICVTAEVKTQGQTGVEMEALCAVSTACLTLYDMLKASDKSMTITDITLIEKRGGQSGHFQRSDG